MDCSPAMEDLIQIEAHHQLYEIMLSNAKPMALKAAVLLDIPRIIATRGNGSPLSVNEIASYIYTSTNKAPHTEYLFRVLRLLASCGVFTQETTVVDGIKQVRYGLTPVSKLLVKEGKQESHAPFLYLATEKAYQNGFQHWHESILEACYPFNKANGISPWEYVRDNPQASRIFNEAMAIDTRTVMASLVEKYEGFKSVKSAVDVAGGVGSALSIILQQYPHLHGINFDLPNVIAATPSILGVDHVAGDMFEGIPCADVVFMKWILHDWDDERCVKLLKNSYKAMPNDGKVLVVEAVIDDKGKNATRLGLLMDVGLMVYSTGGKERTEEEFKRLFVEAGFKSYTITKLSCLQSLIEVSKS